MSTLQKRVAKTVALLEDAADDLDLEYITPSDEEFFRMAGAELRELAGARRLSAVARKAAAEIARRKVNKTLRVG